MSLNAVTTSIAVKIARLVRLQAQEAKLTTNLNQVKHSIDFSHIEITSLKREKESLEKENQVGHNKRQPAALVTGAVEGPPVKVLKAHENQQVHGSDGESVTDPDDVDNGDDDDDDDDSYSCVSCSSSSSSSSTLSGAVMAARVACAEEREAEAARVAIQYDARNMPYSRVITRNEELGVPSVPRISHYHHRSEHTK